MNPEAGTTVSDDHARERMVAEQLAARGITDARVLAAMGRVPRHAFVPSGRARGSAYDDNALPIGHRQTISQPYIVALMTQALGVEPGMKVLEIGTGSGYQTAVLVELGARVFSMEILPVLAESARTALLQAGYHDPSRLVLKVGNGYGGWPQEAPFDRIIVTAAPEHVPPALAAQLGDGGRMIIPVGGSEHQELSVIERHGDRWEREHVLAVMFVPMTGAALD